MINKDSFEKKLKKAEDHLHNENYIEAKNSYLECLAVEPDNLCVLNNLAQIYGMLGDKETSDSYNEILLDKCNKHHVQEETALMFKTNAMISLKRYDKELNETIDDLLKANPKNIVGLFQKAHYLEITNQNKKAIRYHNEILKIEPCNVHALLSKGRNLMELGDFEKAENLYDTVFKIDPKNEDALSLKSKLLKEKLNIRQTPHDFMLKALKHWHEKDFDSSQEDFKKAIDLNPEYNEIWFAQGELFIRTGQIGDAIKSFKKAFELDPNSGGIEKHDEFFKLLNRMKKINTFLGFEK